MLHKLSLTLVILTFGHLAQAQVPQPGRCPEVKIMSEFDLDAYMGIWYEYSKYPFVFEMGKKCMYAEYKNLGNSTISVMNASINRITNSPSNTTGYAKVLGPARLAVVLNKHQNPDHENYLVLATDYKNYAVVYSCTEFGGIFHTGEEVRINVWILTRERKPNDQIIATAKQVMDDNQLSQSFLIDTVQDDCPNPGETNISAANEIQLTLDTTIAKNTMNVA